VEGAVTLKEVSTFRPRELSEGVFQGIGGQRGVQTSQRVAEASLKHDFAVVAAFG
jgi:hypothetical protein